MMSRSTPQSLRNLSQKKARRNARRFKRRLTFEGLERRQMMDAGAAAGTSLSEDMLSTVDFDPDETGQIEILCPTEQVNLDGTIGQVDASPLQNPILPSIDSDDLMIGDEATSQAAAALVQGVVYSNMDSGSGWYAFGPSDYLGYEDYDSVNGDDIMLSEFHFVGGVSNGGETLYVGFYDYFTLAHAGGFFVQFPNSDIGGYSYQTSLTANSRYNFNIRFNRVG